eukprot:2526184-Rhodomonas_salina.3
MAQTVSFSLKKREHMVQNCELLRETAGKSRPALRLRASSLAERRVCVSEPGSSIAYVTTTALVAGIA